MRQKKVKGKGAGREKRKGRETERKEGYFLGIYISGNGPVVSFLFLIYSSWRCDREDAEMPKQGGEK